jgi:hypothetical protein
MLQVASISGAGGGTGPMLPAMRASPVPPLYRAMVLELERRRLAVGISMERMSELMGTAERSYAKMMHPETSSGRMVQWPTMQAVVDVLYCDGMLVRLMPMRAGSTHEWNAVQSTEGTRRLIKAEAARWDAKMRREAMAAICREGGKARAAKMTAKQRSDSARHAAKARWAKVRAAA